MTIKEFSNTKFTGEMKVSYKGKIYNLRSINFEEYLFGLQLEQTSPGLDWVRIENCELIA